MAEPLGEETTQLSATKTMDLNGQLSATNQAGGNKPTAQPLEEETAQPSADKEASDSDSGDALLSNLGKLSSEEH